MSAARAAAAADFGFTYRNRSGENVVLEDGSQRAAGSQVFHSGVQSLEGRCKCVIGGRKDSDCKIWLRQCLCSSPKVIRSSTSAQDFIDKLQADSSVHMSHLPGKHI